MLIIRSPVFIICCLLFLLHQFLQKVLHYTVPLVDSFLDSFLAMPILLTLLVAERRLIFRRGSSYCLSIPEIIAATLLIAFIAEVVFPALSKRFTADWFDVLAYVLGSTLFYFTINSYPKRKQEQPQD